MKQVRRGALVSLVDCCEACIKRYGRKSKKFSKRAINKASRNWYKKQIKKEEWQ